MGRLTLTGRLLILTLIALAPALVVLTFNIFIARTDALKEVHKAALANGHLASLEMNRILSSVRSTLEVLTLVPAVDSADPAICNNFLANVDTKLDMIANLFVLSPDGSLRCGSTTPTAINLGDRTYFAEAVRTRDFVVAGYITDRITGKAVLPVALPKIEKGAIRNVIVALLDLQWLGQRVKERDFSQGNAMTIGDRDGIILAREPFPEKFVGQRIPERFLEQVRAKKPGTALVLSQDGTERILGFYPAAYGLYLSAGLSLDNELQEIRSMTLTGTAVVVLTIFGPFLVVWLASRALIHRPAARLVDTVRAWQNGETTARTEMRGISEFETVGMAIDDFMDQLVTSREQRQNDEKLREILVRELDHRIKNLLATIQAVARQTFKSGGSIEEISESFMRRLHAMAGAHQLLTKNWQSASLDATVKTAIAPFKEENRTRFVLDGADMEISAGAALALSMALHELCTNATKYGALSTEEGQIAIHWAEEENPSESLFVLSWTESGGPPVGQPQREGFGTLMIERVLSQQLNAKILVQYLPGGLVCIVRAPAASLRIWTEQKQMP